MAEFHERPKGQVVSLTRPWHLTSVHDGSLHVLRLKGNFDSLETDPSDLVWLNATIIQTQKFRSSLTLNVFFLLQPAPKHRCQNSTRVLKCVFFLLLCHNVRIYRPCLQRTVIKMTNYHQFCKQRPYSKNTSSKHVNLRVQTQILHFKYTKLHCGNKIEILYQDVIKLYKTQKTRLIHGPKIFNIY